MPLTNGEKIVLFMMLSTRSELRLQLEGVPSAGGPWNKPPADPDELVARLKQLAGSVAVVPAHIDNALLHLFDKTVSAGIPINQIGNITTRHGKLIQELGLVGVSLNGAPPYSPDNPCPIGTNQTVIAQAILNLIP